MSVARTAVQNDVGGKTQIVSLVQCIIIFIVVMALGTFLEPLPKSCLGAIVMVSVFKLMLQVTELMRLWRLSLVDWVCESANGSGPVHFVCFRNGRSLRQITGNFRKNQVLRAFQGLY